MTIVVDSRQRHRRRLGARHPARARLQVHRAVLARSTATSRTTTPIRASPRTCAELIRRVAGRRRRARPGLRRRRRPARRRHQGRQHHLSRPPADAVRARRAEARAGRARSSTTSSARSASRRVIRAAGGEPLMWKTGHSLIKAKMREIGAPLAGEMSGHIFFERALVRLRRRHLRRRRACSRSSARAPTRAPCSTRCRRASRRPS